MTIAANRPAPVLSPGAAQETLREMAAVIRTVFGVGLQASRQAAADAALASEPVMNEVEAAPAAPESPAVTTGSIPVPGLTPTEGIPAAGIPVPGIPAPETSESPAATTGSIPMPSIPLPDVPEAEAEVPQIQPEPQIQQPQLQLVDTAYAAPAVAQAPVEEPVEVPALVVPALAVVPQPAPVEVSNEKRAALLQELAFLDD